MWSRARFVIGEVALRANHSVMVAVVKHTLTRVLVGTEENLDAWNRVFAKYSLTSSATASSLTLSDA